MIEDQITALAREYAEEMIKGRPSEELPNCLKNSILTMNTEYIAEIFRWLSTRYCLVRKNNIIEEYEEAKILCGNLDPCGKNYAWNECKMRLLESLFPEIAKEMEG